jgi:hypothetical protein
VTELPEDQLVPEDEPEDEPERDDDDEPRWSGEESLGLLPPD